jgi:hypothetical protein
VQELKKDDTARAAQEAVAKAGGHNPDNS